MGSNFSHQILEAKENGGNDLIIENEKIKSKEIILLFQNLIQEVKLLFF